MRMDMLSKFFYELPGVENPNFNEKIQLTYLFEMRSKITSFWNQLNIGNFLSDLFKLEKFCDSINFALLIFCPSEPTGPTECAKI